MVNYGCEVFVLNLNRNLLILPLFPRMYYLRVRTYVPYHQQTAAIQFVFGHDFLPKFCTGKSECLAVNRIECEAILKCYQVFGWIGIKNGFQNSLHRLQICFYVTQMNL